MSVSMLSSILEQLRLASPKVCSVIIESYGIGYIPIFQSVQNTLEAMHQEDKMDLVKCTQVFVGGVNYNEYETGAWMKEKGSLVGKI